jgi:hypothetical protein
VPGTDGYRAAAGIAAQVNTVTLASITATDRAGNSVTISRRYFADDNSTPPTAAIAAPGNIGTSNPTLSASYTDDVKVAGANVYFNYGTNLDAAGGTDNFVLPYQVQSTPFANTLNATNTSASLTIATPAPMATSIVASGAASATTYTKLANFGVNAFSAFGQVGTGTDAMAGTGLTTFAALAATGPTVTVGNTLAAANGAGAGLKATFNTVAASGTNVFARVDFYRRNGADNFEYLGSGSSAVQSTDLSGNQIFTWVIDSYANNPTTGVAQRTAAAGDVIIAMAVRSTGAATITTATTIGGPAITVTIAGTEGNAGNVVISGPNGFTQTVTVSGTYGMPTVGDYTLTQFPVTTASGGRYFITGNPANLNLGTLTLVANGAPQAVTATYLASKFTLTYTAATNTAPWSSVPTNAFATLANATTGFSQQFVSATAGFVLPTTGSAFTLATTANTANSAIAIEGVSSVPYALTVGGAGSPFTPANNANATSTVDIAYEWTRSFRVVYRCDNNLDATFAAGECPVGANAGTLTGGYIIGDEATAGTFVSRKTVTAATSGKYHALATNAATTKLSFNGSFSVDTSAGWMVSGATADSVYGPRSGVVTPGLSSAAVTLNVDLVKAIITIAPARVGNAGGAQFQPSVTITKGGDTAGACTVTLDAITSGAAAAANRLYSPTCGAGTYFVTFNPTVVGGNTISWITGAGVRIQTAVITGALPQPAALAAVWMN